MLWNFAKREWLSILVWSALGAGLAGVTHLVFQDKLFEAFVVAKYLPSPKNFDDTSRYFPYALGMGVVFAVAIAIYALEFIERGFRSWITGVTSGLGLLSFSSMFVILTLYHESFQRQIFIDLEVVAGWFVLGYSLHLAAKVHASRTLAEEDFRVPSHSRLLAGTETAESDDPIQSWREDALNRAAVVDNISTKLIIAKTPVLGLFGEFGSGKTSILNLLRENLGSHAIVVSFSTWLPGSQETLTSYLLSDIANQCQKTYVVPGLSRSARRLASALAQTVPFLKGSLELLPAPTQKDDIESNRDCTSIRCPLKRLARLSRFDLTSTRTTGR